MSSVRSSSPSTTRSPMTTCTPSLSTPPPSTSDPGTSKSASSSSPLVDPIIAHQRPSNRLSSAIKQITQHLGDMSQAGIHKARQISPIIQPLSHALHARAKQLWSLCDLRTMLQPHADDPLFLSQLRGEDRENQAQITFSQCRHQLHVLSASLAEVSELSPSLRQQLQRNIDAVSQALDPLENGTAATMRAVKGLINLVNLWPALVPSPLLANQAKTFAYTVAAASKAVLSVAGSTLRPTADGLPFPLMGGELGRQANEVHFYPALLNAIFLATEMSKKYGTPAVQQTVQQLDRSTTYHVGIAMACGAALITPFMWSSVAQSLRHLKNHLARMSSQGLAHLGLQQWAEAIAKRLTPVQVSTHIRQQMHQILTQLETGRTAFEQARQEFTDPKYGRELTRTVNAQCTHLLTTLQRCADDLAEMFALRDPPTSAQQTQGFSRHLPKIDANFGTKLALTLFAGAVTGLTVVLIRPDPIGTVDLSADSVVVTAVMAQTAWNHQATRQDAMERFKGMAATSMVMALALSADKIADLFRPGGLIGASTNAQYYAAVIMALMAMTLPGPIARGAELAINRAGQHLLGLCHGPDQAPLATQNPLCLQEMHDHIRAVNDYLQQLDPDQRRAYETLVGERLVAQMSMSRHPRELDQQPQS